MKGGGNNFFNSPGETLNRGETIIFSFNSGAAIDVSYTLSRIGFAPGDTDGDNILGEATLEAFGVGGVSLGTVEVGDETFNINVSQLFNGKSISKFQLTAIDYLAIESLSFTPNQLPVAVDDSATTRPNTAKTLPVTTLLANDTDPDGNPLSITAVGNPTNGTVTLNNNNTPGDTSDDTVIFTPNNNFTGNATFEYTLSDGKDGSDTGLVTVAVGKNINGTIFNDNLTGTPGNDVILGLSGDDIIKALAGDDFIDGGRGFDTITGGPGADTFVLNPNYFLSKDTITDFKVVEEDKIGLAGGLTYNNLTFSGSNINVKPVVLANLGIPGINIGIGSYTLATLTGVDTTTLTANNFTTVQ